MSDDPTTRLPDTEQGYDTRPGVTAILERINELGERLAARIGAVESNLSARIDELSGQLAETRAEMSASFLMLGKKIDTLALDILQVRTDQKLLEDRVEKIERKPS
jgi:hypothetical protein